MSRRAPQYTITDHFDGRRFVNPNGQNGQPFSALPKLFVERRAAWPRDVPVAARRPPMPQAGQAILTFVGHATWLMQTPYGNVLTDPMYSDRAGPLNVLGPRRVRQPAIPFDNLPPIAMVLLSHNHYDHCDGRTLERLARRFDPLVVTPLGNAPLVRSAGISRVEELDWWQASKMSPLPVTATPAQHFSARTPFDRNRALWSGFVVTIGSQRVYFAGDTAYAPFFTDIKQRLGPIDVALLPIGAYEPRWFMQQVHMNPAEAVQAHLDLEATHSIGMHFGTFQLTTESIDDPLHRLEAARRERDVSIEAFHTLEFGESKRLGSAA